MLCAPQRFCCNISPSSSIMTTTSGINQRSIPSEVQDAKARLKQRHAADESSQSWTTATSTGTTSVTSSLGLPESIRKNIGSLNSVSLAPLNLSDDKLHEKAAISFKTALKKECKRASNGKKQADVAVVFAIRRPGCSSSREQGQQLSALAMEFCNLAVFGIVKESGAAEEQNLIAFYNDHFQHPIYKDDECQIYKAMGNRKLNSIQLVKGNLAAKRRWADKAIPQKSGGENRVQGGILFFKNGKLRCAYQEEYGKELDVSNIRATIKELQEEQEDVSCSETLDGW
ncbi:hypothetical protein MPSEU_000042000 [Mayamaea pseudoterrestris]|nr:hypothetical protein MPSEU_000042000 [Mayamaea pseudoterrestris]